jgi:hypothetical protein
MFLAVSVLSVPLMLLLPFPVNIHHLDDGMMLHNHHYTEFRIFFIYGWIWICSDLLLLLIVDAEAFIHNLKVTESAVDTHHDLFLNKWAYHALWRTCGLVLTARHFNCVLKICFTLRTIRIEIKGDWTRASFGITHE